MATIAGQYITDGTAVFIIRDTRDGTPVGRPITDDILRDSYVKRNGALLQRSSYPTLVKFLQDNPSLVTSESNWPANKNLWTLGDGSTTFRVPDDRGLYEQLSDSIGLVAAGLPNITGSSTPSIINRVTHSGALYLTESSTDKSTWPAGTGNTWATNIDASRSSKIYGNSTTVTPPSVRRIAQMKY